MSKAHEIYGAIATYYDSGGGWIQHAGNRPDGSCLSYTMSRFISKALELEVIDKYWGIVRQEMEALMRREVGVGVVEFNDSPTTDKTKVIETCWDICTSPELE